MTPPEGKAIAIALEDSAIRAEHTTDSMRLCFDFHYSLFLLKPPPIEA